MEKQEISLDELDNIFGGVTREVGIEKTLEHPETYRQQKIAELKPEISLDELDNIFGGITREVGIEKTLEHPETYRQQKIAELKQERDALTSLKEYDESHTNTQSGRSK